MHVVLLILGTFFGGGVWGASAPIMEGSQEDIAAIQDVFARWAKARDAGDVDGVVAVHHPDMLIMTRNREILVGHEGVRRFYAENYAESSDRVLLSSVRELRVFDDVAVVIGQFLALDPGKEIEDPGYYLILLRKNVDGQWLIYRDIDTPSPDGLALKTETADDAHD